MITAINCRLLLKDKLEGIGWFTYETVNRITRSHPEHTFHLIFDRPHHPSFVFSDNCHPITLPPATRHPILWYYWFEWQLPRLLKRLKPDLFFSPDGYLSLRSNIPQVAVIHDINFAHRPADLPWWPRNYYNYFFPRFARKAERICTVSEFSKKDIVNTYGIEPEKISVVYNGAKTLYRPLSDKEIRETREKYTEGQPYFIFVGSLHPRKNLENLLKAYDRFCDQQETEVRMLIVGESMWGSQITHSTSPITYTGRLQPEELAQVMGSALALTFVPWFEGFGIPVLEAMQAGVPVLTSNRTSLPEVGGEAVLYADPGDVEGIATQMKQLATDSTLRAQLKTKGLAQARHFSWEKTSEKVWTTISNFL